MKENSYLYKGPRNFQNMMQNASGMKGNFLQYSLSIGLGTLLIFEDSLSESSRKVSCWKFFQICQVGMVEFDG